MSAMGLAEKQNKMKSFNNTALIILTVTITIGAAIMSGKTGNRDFIVVSAFFAVITLFFIASHGREKRRNAA